MSTINIHRGTFLEKEELVRMVSFLNENPLATAMAAASLSFGLVTPGAVAAAPFTVSVSSTLGTVDMTGGYVITPNLKSYKVDSQEALSVPSDGLWYWLKVGAETVNYEKGYVQVDASGNVSGTVNFAGIVRGQSSGVPTCIRFTKDDGEIPLNDQVYQVVNIINANNIVLSSGYPFQAENQLRVLVLGSIPMGNRFTEEQLEGLYSFDSYKLSFVAETAPETAPSKALNEYWIARVRNQNGIITVEDKRTEFWQLASGGADVPGAEYDTFMVRRKA